LGFHYKPCGVLNVNDFYQPLNDLLQHMVNHNFLKQDFKNMLLFNDDVNALLDDIQTFEFPQTLKWH
ncbi:MAG: LOG family protein, partial [Bacteroidia bacterium]